MTINQEKRDPLNNPADFLEMGKQLAGSKAGAMANAMVDRVLQKHGGDPLWEAIGAAITQHHVPDYHLRMVQDTDRNAAYRKAIEIHAPGKIVLDIGTGSGLLSMMAARAGAKKVIACEANAMLADRAKSVIAANGLSDIITVMDRHSSKLNRDADLMGGAQLVVSEIFSTDLLYENVLQSLSDARARLTTPDAIFIPEHARIKVALARFKESGAVPQSVEGFDLSPFSPHFTTVNAFPTDDRDLALVSDPASLFAFDFRADTPLSLTGQRGIELESHGGHVSGLAQWVELQFGHGIGYENAPGANDAHHWYINTIERDPRDTAKGERFSVGGWYSKTHLECWLEASTG
ncbi:MAG: 50S ribosomal protein L11 methyltransferase [Erythrobacter sp.]